MNIVGIEKGLQREIARTTLLNRSLATSTNYAQGFQLQLINCLFCSVGALQFLASMPFDAISTNAAWSLLNRLISTSGDSTDGQNKLARLKSLIGDVPSTEEMIFLFTALSNMAISRSKDDREFINCVAIDLLEVFLLSSFATSCTVDPRVRPPLRARIYYLDLSIVAYWS